MSIANGPRICSGNSDIASEPLKETKSQGKRLNSEREQDEERCESSSKFDDHARRKAQQQAEKRQKDGDAAAGGTERGICTAFRGCTDLAEWRCSHGPHGICGCHYMTKRLNFLPVKDKTKIGGECGCHPQSRWVFIEPRLTPYERQVHREKKLKAQELWDKKS